MPDPKPETVRLTIDGTTVAVPKGTLVIEAARRVGVMIPHFCYHPKLKPDANCRMCLVEVEKMPKLQTACSTPVAEGMAVRTATTTVDDAHKSVLEFILANHPPVSYTHLDVYKRQPAGCRRVMEVEEVRDSS